MGVLRLQRLAGSWRPLDRLVSFRPSGPRRGITGGLVLGAVLRGGGHPCIGPTLGAILTMAPFGSPMQAAALLMAYSTGAGHPVPGPCRGRREDARHHPDRSSATPSRSSAAGSALVIIGKRHPVRLAVVVLRRLHPVARRRSSERVTGEPQPVASGCAEPGRSTDTTRSVVASAHRSLHAPPTSSLYSAPWSACC